MDKNELRSWAHKIRKQALTQELSAALCRHLELFVSQQKLQHIMTYKAFGSELNPTALETLYKANYYLPRVQGEDMTVHLTPCDMAKNPLGMYEPSQQVPQAASNLIEVVLVPALCYDAKGFRVGYGKGFYDRFFAFLDHQPLLIGVTSSKLIVDHIDHEPWDVPVQYIATELGVQQVS